MHGFMATPTTPTAMTSTVSMVPSIPPPSSSPGTTRAGPWLGSDAAGEGPLEPQVRTRFLRERWWHKLTSQHLVLPCQDLSTMPVVAFMRASRAQPPTLPGLVLRALIACGFFVRRIAHVFCAGEFCDQQVVPCVLARPTIKRRRARSRMRAKVW
jgi:hypothetical protein